VVAVKECSDSYAETSTHVTFVPRDGGNDIILVRIEASVNATIREEEGHQQGAGEVTVSPLSSHATHSSEVPLQYTRPAQV
jgi:hypothetical protein